MKTCLALNHIRGLDTYQLAKFDQMPQVKCSPHHNMKHTVRDGPQGDVWGVAEG